jgi:peptidoglycan/xylan/chitin deacetylase (PgdA/CDA1 family)
MIPHRTPFFLPWLYPTLTWRIHSENTVFLTFDDGPVSGPTEFVLDTLAQRSITATFFCIGDNISKHPAIFQKIVASGHTVGNHTVNHLNGWRTKTDTYVSNVKAFDDIAANAGYPERTRLFRPPYGCITRKEMALLNDYDIIMWDVLSQDYDKNLSPEKCLRQTMKACRPGSVIVFHDSYKSQRNMEYALPRLIDFLGGEGLDFGVIPSPKS